MNSTPNSSHPPQESEPVAGSDRAPVWLLVLVAMLAFWGMGFWDNHGGGFNAQVYAPYNSIGELDGDRIKPAEDPAWRGRKVFVQLCAQCHAETGRGNPSTQAPPLVHSEWVLAEGPNRLIRIVLNGLQGPVDVDGRHFESNAMLPWRDTLTNDADIAAVLTFLRGNKDWGHEASAITAEQVARVRAETRDRAGQWTVSELLKIPEQ